VLPRQSPIVRGQLTLIWSNPNQSTRGQWMGIQGLLKELGPLLRTRTNIRHLPRGRVGVDGSAWLFKAAYACAMELALGKETRQLEAYIMRRVAMLRDAGFAPIMCFDGRRPRLKDAVAQGRRAKVRMGRAKALELLEEAKKATDPEQKRLLESQASAAFASSISVTFEHTLPVLRALRRQGIPYIVAPFEADAQLAFLAKQGYCSTIITDDSDIAVFLTACGAGANVLYRFSDFGEGDLLTVRAGGLSKWVLTDALIPYSKRARSTSPSARPPSPPPKRTPGVGASFAASPDKARPSFDSHPVNTAPPSHIVFLKKLSGLSHRQFVQLCVLAGCDYLASPVGIGLRTGLKYLDKAGAVGDDSTGKRVAAQLEKDHIPLPDSYDARFHFAEAGFFWHVVFDPFKKVATFLAPLSDTPPSVKAERALSTLGEAVSVPRPVGSGSDESECPLPELIDDLLLEQPGAEECLSIARGDMNPYSRAKVEHPQGTPAWSGVPHPISVAITGGSMFAFPQARVARATPSASRAKAAHTPVVSSQPSSTRSAPVHRPKVTAPHNAPQRKILSFFSPMTTIDLSED
jgi:5'-3' exonuclease